MLVCVAVFSPRHGAVRTLSAFVDATLRSSRCKKPYSRRSIIVGAWNQGRSERWPGSAFEGMTPWWKDFSRAVRRGRLAHAYLFTGAAGVGKRLFAVELAKALLCETAAEGACKRAIAVPSCVQVEADTHPDFFTAVRPPDALEFPIDLMRQLCQSFALKSARGRGKVVLIDDADDLNEEAANCFSRRWRSRRRVRCLSSSAARRIVNCKPSSRAVRSSASHRCRRKWSMSCCKRKASRMQSAARLVRLSAGSPGMAKELADPALWDFRRDLLDGLTKTPIDSVDLSRQWMDFVEEAGKESAAQRRRAQLVLRLIIDFLDDALTVAMNGPPRRTEEEERPGLETLAQRRRRSFAGSAGTLSGGGSPD